MSEQYQLTPVELELMEILWKLGQGSVREVMAHLAQDRALAYTSVSTILRIMQQKKMLTAIKMGKQHIYQPCFTKQTYASHSVNKMVKQVFSGSPLELVAYLVKKSQIKAEEIQALQKLIDDKKKELA